MQRKRITDDSKVFESMDLGNQEKLLILGLNLVSTLQKSSPKPALMGAEEGYDFKIEITEAILFVRQVEVSPSLLLGTERRLRTESAI